MPTPPRRWLAACLAALLAHGATAFAAESHPLPGYQSADQFDSAVAALADNEIVTHRSLGKTAEGRDVHLLTIGTGDVDTKPAVLVVGSVDAANLTGSELALRMAQQLAATHGEGDESAADLLDRVTLYFIPRPSPDASAHVMDSPKVFPITGRATNSRSTDADRDGQVDEDPPEDLNGDGVITQMRVADATGPWMEHPNDSRILVRADAKKNETGQYQVYTEGVDNDDDQAWNEDGPGGVDFNRNLTFDYAFFAGDAGPHQVSEPESRAVVDWMFTRPNIFMVFSFAPQENLAKPWTPAKNNGGRIKRQVLRDDGPYLGFIAKRFAKEVGNKNAPRAAGNAGAFAPWAYYHYGRWSLATRGWWIPKVDPKKSKTKKEPESPKPSETESDDTESKASDSDVKNTNVKKPDVKKPDAKKEDTKAAPKPAAKKKQDSRNASDINALAWFDQQGVEGFVDWTEVEHPDFKGKRVEVGGFKPLMREHPPVDELDALATKHGEFLANAIGLAPRLEFADVVVESLGEGVHRITATVANVGYLPTVSTMGRSAAKLQRLQIKLTLPEGSTWLVGDEREDLGVLAGSGGRKEVRWLVRVPTGTSSLALRAGEPSVGYCEETIELEGSNDADQEVSNKEATE